MASRQEWREYYAMQKTLWQWIEQNSKTLYSVENCEPVHTKDPSTGFEITPKYVRAILQLTHSDVEAELLQRIRVLDELYKKLTEKDKSPENLPCFLRNVTNITVSKSDAYKSIKLARCKDKDKLPQYLLVDLFKVNHEVFGGIEKERLDHTIKQLTDSGIDFKMGTNELSTALYVTHDSVLDFAKSEYVQARFHTGPQYRAMVRFAEDNLSVRHKLGFIVLASQTQATIQNAISEPKRRHSLMISGDRIEFPVKVEFELYRK